MKVTVTEKINFIMVENGVIIPLSTIDERFCKECLQAQQTHLWGGGKYNWYAIINQLCKKLEPANNAQTKKEWASIIKDKRKTEEYMIAEMMIAEWFLSQFEIISLVTGL